MLKHISSLLMIGMLAIPIFATEETVPQYESIQQAMESQIGTISVDSSVIFDETEYVRITQPIVDNEEEYVITTFEHQINMMGEARAGTQLIVTVQHSDETSKLYELELVGATQTFNQLIELGERQNLITIYYSHEAFDEHMHSLMFQIYRQPEENKSQLKNYIISTPSDLPEGLNEKQHY